MLVYLFLVALFSQGFCAPANDAHHLVKRQLLSPFMFDYARPPTGVYAGSIGGLFGSPIFGPPLMGPFNDPAFREQRIIELFDENRRLNDKPLMRERFRLSNF